jgi:hypothetical protein
MKTIHEYNETLELFLMKLNDLELDKWFKSNTIEYNETLNEVMIKERKKNVDNDNE